MVTKSEISKVLSKDIDIKNGDVVMIHSSYKSTGGVEGGPKTLLQAFIDSVGPLGTLLIPTFNFTSWSKEHYYDILETPSQMGALTEIARKSSTSKRTEHPFYSFAVIGEKQSTYISCNTDSAMGPDSVFDEFLKDNGKIVSIGLDYNDSFTMVHQVEAMNNVSYRRNKEFGGLYIDEKRNVSVRKYSMLVRGNLKIKTQINPAMEYLFNEGVIKRTFLGKAEVKYCEARPFYDTLSPLVKIKPEYFHSK